jgi:hypothetical protein
MAIRSTRSRHGPPAPGVRPHLGLRPCLRLPEPENVRIRKPWWQPALADLLLIDGDPISDIKLLEDAKNLVVIMKDGKIYKNTLSK